MLHACSSLGVEKSRPLMGPKRPCPYPLPRGPKRPCPPPPTQGVQKAPPPRHVASRTLPRQPLRLHLVHLPVPPPLSPRCRGERQSGRFGGEGLGQGETAGGAGWFQLDRHVEYGSKGRDPGAGRAHYLRVAHFSVIWEGGGVNVNIGGCPELVFYVAN